MTDIVVVLTSRKIILLLAGAALLLIAGATAYRKSLDNMVRAEYANPVEAIVKAQTSYREMFPKRGYACKLSQLGQSGLRTPTEDAAELLDSALTSGTKGGLRFDLACKPSAPGGPVNGYTVTARPLSPETGRLSFCGDETGVIKLLPASGICSEGKKWDRWKD